MRVAAQQLMPGSWQCGEEHVTAEEYLQKLSLEDRRSGGLVYTPIHLVDFTLAQAGYHPRATIEKASFLDPSCGGGVFLERGLRVLAARFAKLGFELDRPSGHQVFVDAVHENLFGIDVDARACEMTRATVRRRVLELSPGPLPVRFFEANVAVADFLLDDVVTRGEPLGSRGLHFIVGNPPYVSATRITSSYKAELRQRFHSASGRLDLYTVFIERAISLLGDRGRLAVITPDKFLVSQSARGLREFILRTSTIRSIAKFRSHKVFDDVATIPCVTVLERGRRPRDIAVLTCAEKPTSKSRVQVLRKDSIPYTVLSAGTWQVSSPEWHALARRLQGQHPTLSQLALRVSAGPATGRDGLYVFPVGSQPDIEPELLRSVVRGRDVQAYKLADPEMQMLVPYVFDAAGKPTLIELSKYPGARRYLELHRADLENRHCVRVWGKRWYDLHDQVLLDLAKRTKLLVPDVADSNRFAVDQGRFLPLHSVYYALLKPGVDLHFLTGVLNSSVATFLIRLFAPVVKDGFNRYRQQFLATLPIPTPLPQEVQAISQASRSGDAAETERRVQKLFRLTRKEVETLRAYRENSA